MRLMLSCIVISPNVAGPLRRQLPSPPSAYLSRRKPPLEIFIDFWMGKQYFTSSDSTQSGQYGGFFLGDSGSALVMLTLK